MKKKILIIDNFKLLEYYLKHLKDDYTVLSVDIKAKAILDAKRIDNIWILDYLNYRQLGQLKQKAFVASQALLKQLDDNNQDNYRSVFGVSDLRLLNSTIQYLFIRFTRGLLWLINGLEQILNNHEINEIAFLHSGNPRNICGTKKERGFFYPDDIIWKILKQWKASNKPKIVFIKAKTKPFTNIKNSTSLKTKTLKVFLDLKNTLYPIKERLLTRNPYKFIFDKNRKSILFAGPLYDLEIVSKDLASQFNLIKWDSDGKYLNKEIKNIFATPAKEYPFNCSADIPEYFQNFTFKELSLELISSFYSQKITDILHYWKQADAIHEKYSINVMFWNNAPHRYPVGIVKEYFRIKNIPIVGMQHGGKTGSSDLGETLKTLDFNNCNYYFSYGFKEDDIDLNINEVLCNEIIPVGSVRMNRLKKSFSFTDKAKEQLDIIFPLQVSSEKFFASSEMMNPKIFEFQKRIISCLAQMKNKKIALKFLPGKYLESAIGEFVRRVYANKFLIIDNMSFSQCLSKFQINTVLIEEQSTPLNEALLSDCNILVYNNPQWSALTPVAYSLLSKRAHIYNDEQSFINKIKLNDYSKDAKDKSDLSFLRKYGYYNEMPESNITNFINKLLN